MSQQTPPMLYRSFDDLDPSDWGGPAYSFASVRALHGPALTQRRLTHNFKTAGAPNLARVGKDREASFWLEAPRLL